MHAYSVLLAVIQVQIALKNIDGWDFDILNMETVSKLRSVGVYEAVCTILWLLESWVLYSTHPAK